MNRLLNTKPEIYLSNNYLVLDFETTSFDYGSWLHDKNKIVLACWTIRGEKKYCFGAEYDQQELIKDISSVDFIVAQNSKFELGWLDRCGMDLHNALVWDTMLAEWVILGNRKLPKDLGSMCKRRNIPGKEDVVGGMIKLGIDSINIPKSLLLNYCHEDVRATEELFLMQREEIVEREQLHLVLSRCMLTPVLVDIEKQGIHLDKEKVYEEYNTTIAEKYEAEQRLKAFGDINWNSRQQVAALLYDQLGFSEIKDKKGNPVRTKAGARSTDTATLSALKATNKDQREFLEAFASLAKLNAKLSKNLQFFRTVCEENDGVFYGVFNQGTTSTHRLSSSGKKVVSADGEIYSAQLQNIPREYKKLITPRNKGYSILEADASQLEFRVAADIGRDATAAEEIKNGVDIHSNTAAVYIEDGTNPEFKGKTVKEARQLAKAKSFAPLYGGRGKTKADNKYAEFWRNKYSGIFATQTRWTHEVLKDGKLRTPYGMEFYWPNTRISESGYVDNTTAIFNFPIQGFATAEIIPLVLVFLWHKLKDKDVKLILTVHDSIVMEVGPDVDRHELYDTITYAFTSNVYEQLDRLYNYTFTVPLDCEIKEGAYWGDGEGVKGCDVDKYFLNKGEMNC